MSLTRRHYVAIAEALADSRPQATHEDEARGWGRAVNAVAHALAADNPRFDHERFVVACGAGAGARDVVLDAAKAFLAANPYIYFDANDDVVSETLYDLGRAVASR